MKGVFVMNEPIHHEIEFKAKPEQIYSILTDAKKFSGLMDDIPTEINPEPGGAFSCFGGMIVGRNIELVANERIVQAWRVKSWQPGIYSIAKFELKDDGNKTQLIFDHTGFPEEERDHLDSGWFSNYWEPIKKILD